MVILQLSSFLHLHCISNSQTCTNSPETLGTPTLYFQFSDMYTQSRNTRLKPPSSSSLDDNTTISDYAISIVKTLNLCTSSRNPKLGFCIHSKVLKSGLDCNVSVNNSLLDVYVKTGHLHDAAKLFDDMSERTVVTWTSMISGYSNCGLADEAVLAFAQMVENDVCPNEFTLAAVLKACGQRSDRRLILAVQGYVMKYGFCSDAFVLSSLVGAYAKSCMAYDAVRVIRRLGLRDVVAWTSVISGCVSCGMAEEAVKLFFQMQKEEVPANEITILSILHACSMLKQRRVFKWVHGLVLKLALYGNELIANSLVETYLVNGCFEEAMRVFCEFGFGSNGKYLGAETMASLLQGYQDLDFVKLGKQIHGYLTKHGFFPCTIIENSLIDMYGEIGHSVSAFSLFTRMKNRDIVSWNSMAKCFVRCGQFQEALGLLKEIHKDEKRDSVCPDHVTMLTSLQACSTLALLRPGEVIHGDMTKTGLACDFFVQNALIDMYGRTGGLESAEKIFEDIPIKDTDSYNSLIAAYGVNGNSTKALQLFSELKESGTCEPNEITFTNILSACSHAGVMKGLEIFDSMQRDYKLEAGMEHFACVMGMLGRSGRLEEAADFIGKMPIKPGKDIWCSLLGACGFFRNVGIAEKAAEELLVLEPEGTAWRVALSNVYASVGRWRDAMQVRAQMRGLDRKESGWSCVEIEGEMFKFMVNDTRHPQSELIYGVLSIMKEHTRND